MLVNVFAAGFSGGWIARHQSAGVFASNLLFFVLQGLFVGRLVRKRYRSFRLAALRDNGEQSSRLSSREIVSVWLWLVWPQVAFMLAAWLVLWLCGSRLPHEFIRSLGSLSVWARFLLVGPYSLGLALGMQYRGFRFQAYGYRHA